MNSTATQSMTGKLFVLLAETNMSLKLYISDIFKKQHQCHWKNTCTCKGHVKSRVVSLRQNMLLNSIELYRLSQIFIVPEI